MIKNKKRYKQLIDRDTQNVHAAVSRQTLLRWEKCLDGKNGMSAEANSDRPHLGGASSSRDVSPIVETVSDDSSVLIEDRGSACETKHSPIRNVDDSDGSSSLAESFNETFIENELSINDSEGDASDISMMDDDDDDDAPDDCPMNFDDGGCDPPHDIFDDIVMFEAANLTITEVLTMIQALSLKYYMSDEATTALRQLVKILAGPRFENLNLSKYTMARRFNPPEDKISYVFYCKVCCTTLLGPVKKKDIAKLKEQTCESCSKDYQLSASSLNCFVSVDIEYQICSLLENPIIQPMLLKNVRLIQEREMNEEEDICDVHDGRVYKNIVNERSLQDENVLTFNFSTDGAAWFHSSGKSGWPIQMLCNELPPRIRFKNLMLAGLWIAESEPNPTLMNSYLQIFVDQVKTLMQRRVVVKSAAGENISFEILFLHAPVDSVARPIMQNRLQFNGYMGCSWCYQYGEYYARAMRYPFVEDDPDIRTHQEYLVDIANAQALGRNIRGVKGFASLTELPGFDCVWGFPFEYLHTISLGVTRQLWELWTTPGTSWYLNPTDQAEVNRRLLNIKPPQELHRDPRSLKNRAKWKATEWRSWLLFYCICCLSGILRPDAFRSLILFVRSIYRLLSTNITENNLRCCEIDLITFVGDCQVIYGKEAMTFNVHSLLHVVQSVRESGPLWATSAFPFESNIYNLKRQIHGPKGVCDQIVKRTLQMNTFQNSVASMREDSSCTEYCKALFSSLRVSNFVRICEDVTFIGKSLGTDDYQISVDGEINVALGEVYGKCIFKGTVLHGTRYARVCNKTNDNIVQLQCGFIAEIIQFVVINGSGYVEYVRLLTTPVEEQEVEIPHLLRIVGHEESPELEPIANVKCKCIFIDVFEQMYISIPPNVFEIQ